METTLSNGQIVLVKPVGNRGIFTGKTNEFHESDDMTLDTLFTVAEFIKLFVVTYGYTTISVGDIVIAKNPSHPQVRTNQYKSFDNIDQSEHNIARHMTLRSE